MPRRVYSYPGGMGWDWLNAAETIGAVITVIGVLMFIVKVIWSRSHGEIAPANPWGASSLEWSTTSPPPEYNFTIIPTVHGREPLWETHDRMLDGARGETVVPLPTWRVLDDGKETLETTLLDADPQAVLRMPEDSLWPLILALSLTGLFVAPLFKLPVWTAISGAVTRAVLGGWLWPTAATYPPPEVAR